MQYKHKDDQLFCRVEQNLNLVTARQIEHLSEDVSQVYLDLSDARIVDSEGVILLYHLLKAGKKVRLKDPPRIFYEIVEALELSRELPLESMSQSEDFELQAGE